MNIGKLWEAIENGSKLFRESLGCVFDFSSVELSMQSVLSCLWPLSVFWGVRLYISDSADLETTSNLCGKTALSTTEDNIEKLSGIRHRGNILPGGLHVGRLYSEWWWWALSILPNSTRLEEKSSNRIAGIIARPTPYPTPGPLHTPQPPKITIPSFCCSLLGFTFTSLIQDVLRNPRLQNKIHRNLHLSLRPQIRHLHPKIRPSIPLLFQCRPLPPRRPPPLNKHSIRPDPRLLKHRI